MSVAVWEVVLITTSLVGRYGSDDLLRFRIGRAYASAPVKKPISSWLTRSASS
jgi:hypothetical protein